MVNHQYLQHSLTLIALILSIASLVITIISFMRTNNSFKLTKEIHGVVTSK